MQQPEIENLMPLRDWHAEHGASVFRTYDSLKWFIRQPQFRRRLIEDGIYLPSKGPAPSLVDRSRMGDVVVELLQQDRADDPQSQAA